MPAAPYLPSGRFRDPRDVQAGELIERVIAVLLGQPAVDDVDHVINRHGRLRQVRGQDDLSDARRGPLEDELLQGGKGKGDGKLFAVISFAFRDSSVLRSGQLFDLCSVKRTNEPIRR